MSRLPELVATGLAAAALFVLAWPTQAKPVPVLPVQLRAGEPAPVPDDRIVYDRVALVRQGDLSVTRALFWKLPVSLNDSNVGVDQLAAIPGVSKKVAGAVVDRRAAAPILVWADVNALPGVGPKTLAALQAHFSLERR